MGALGQKKTEEGLIHEAITFGFEDYLKDYLKVDKNRKNMQLL
jgi:hypothetical protein